MSAAELAEWEVWSEQHPLHDPYWIGAQIACAIVNANRSKGPPAKIEDFIPKMVEGGEAKARQSPEEMRAIVRAAMGRRA